PLRYKECSGAFGAYSIDSSASPLMDWPVSGSGHWGIHTVAWGEGGLGGGVGGGTGGAHVVEHGRIPWPCGRGEGEAPYAHAAARRGRGGRGCRRCRTDPFGAAEQRVQA